MNLSTEQKQTHRHGEEIWHKGNSIYHIFLIHSSINGHLGCLHVLAIVNSVAMNVQVRVFFSSKVLSGYMPESGIAWSCGISIFSFLRYLHTAIHMEVPNWICFCCTTTGTPVYLLWRKVCSGLLPIFHWGVGFFAAELNKLFVYFRY